MTLPQGRYLATPLVFEAIQWDGTLTGAMEIQHFIEERAHFPGEIVNFHARVFGGENAKAQATIELPPPIGKDQDNTMWPKMWLIFCARPRGWNLLSDDSFRANYEPEEKVLLNFEGGVPIKLMSGGRIEVDPEELKQRPPDEIEMDSLDDPTSLEDSIVHFFYEEEVAIPVCKLSDRDSWMMFDHTAIGKICLDCQDRIGRKIQ